MNTIHSKKVLIHSPGEEHRQLIPWEGDHDLMGPNPRAYEQLQKDHQDLKDFLTKEIKAENIFELKDLLEEIFESAGERKREMILKRHLASSRRKILGSSSS